MIRRKNTYTFPRHPPGYLAFPIFLELSPDHRMHPAAHMNALPFHAVQLTLTSSSCSSSIPEPTSGPQMRLPGPSASQPPEPLNHLFQYSRCNRRKRALCVCFIQPFLCFSAHLSTRIFYYFSLPFRLFVWLRLPFLVYLIRIATVISRSHLLFPIGWYPLPFTTQRAQRLLQ